MLDRYQQALTVPDRIWQASTVLDRCRQTLTHLTDTNKLDRHRQTARHLDSAGLWIYNYIQWEAKLSQCFAPLDCTVNNYFNKITIMPIIISHRVETLSFPTNLKSYNLVKNWQRSKQFKMANHWDNFAPYTSVRGHWLITLWVLKDKIPKNLYIINLLIAKN